MKTATLKSFKAVLGILLGCIACGAVAQQNLLINGNLQHFTVDSIALANKFYKTERLAIAESQWDNRNQCQALYNPEYSYTGNGFLELTLFEKTGPTDFRINNISGQLCRPLLAGKSYRVSFYIKAFSGTAVASGFGVIFSDSVIENKLFFDERAMKKSRVPDKIKPDFLNGQIIAVADSFTKIEFSYKARGGELVLTIGNFREGKPLGWQAVKPYGHLKKVFAYNDWCIYAVSDIKAVAEDESEIGCLLGY
jgi:hypothetical protein